MTEDREVYKVLNVLKGVGFTVRSHDHDPSWDGPEVMVSIPLPRSCSHRWVTDVIFVNNWASVKALGNREDLDLTDVFCATCGTKASEVTSQ